MEEEYLEENYERCGLKKRQYRKSEKEVKKVFKKTEYDLFDTIDALFPTLRNDQKAMMCALCEEWGSFYSETMQDAIKYLEEGGEIIEVDKLPKRV